jgi:hypothetical protein
VCGPLGRVGVQDGGTAARPRGVPISAELQARHLVVVHLVGAVGQAQVASGGVRRGQTEVVGDPRPPTACIARSIARQDIVGATTLIMAISERAALLPPVSMAQAALNAIRTPLSSGPSPRTRR